MTDPNTPNTTPTSPTPAKNKNWIVIVLSVLIILLLLFIGLKLMKNASNQRQEARNQLSEMEQKLKDLEKSAENGIKDAQKDITDNLSDDKDGKPENPVSGWNTYVNDKYGYEFKYPKEAVVKEADISVFSLSPEEKDQGLTIDSIYNTYTGKICVNLEYKYGYVTISAPENAGFKHVICGRTGFAYELTKKTDALTIDSKAYTAEGSEEKGPANTLNYHNETLVVTLDDGTRIEYGAKPDATATYDDYLKMKEEILAIVESYASTK